MAIMFTKQLSIKEIPASCRKCPLCEWGSDGVMCDLPLTSGKTKVKAIYWSKRHKNCPLVEVED